MGSVIGHKPRANLDSIRNFARRERPRPLSHRETACTLTGVGRWEDDSFYGTQSLMIGLALRRQRPGYV
jgi:hypothetical protein